MCLSYPDLSGNSSRMTKQRLKTYVWGDGSDLQLKPMNFLRLPGGQ